MANSTDQEIRVASHEVGHVVMALLQGIPVAHVSIVADDKAAGRAFIRALPSECKGNVNPAALMRCSSDVLSKRVLVAVSGVVSEGVMRGSGKAALESDSDDCKNARRYALNIAARRYLAGEKVLTISELTDKVIEEHMLAAFELLTANEALIRELVGVIRTHKEITGRILLKTFRGHRADRKTISP